MQVTDDIRLEVLDLHHAEAMFSALDTNREVLREWLPFVDSTRQIFDSTLFIEFSKTGPDMTYAILYQGQFAGLIGIKDIDSNNQRAELGYWVSPEYWNKGIITRVSQYLIDYAFRSLGINRMQIKVAVGNGASNRVVEKLGFVFEGIERDGEKEVWGFTDINVYSLLKREWETRQSK